MHSSNKMWWTVLFFILNFAHVLSECTRPTDFHWLKDDTPTNNSLELFSGNSGSIERIFFDFSHSKCYKRGTNGQHVLYCAEKVMNLPCTSASENQIGLGQNSPVWAHYQHMVIDSQRISFNNDLVTYSEVCEFQPKLPLIRSHHLCHLNNISTSWNHNGHKKQNSFSIMMFGTEQQMFIPRTLMQTFEEAIQKKEYDEIYFTVTISGKQWKCGENCIYTNSMITGFEFWADVHNDPNTIQLNERFLNYKKIKYSSYSQTIEIQYEDVYIQQIHKFWVQLVLLPKILYGFWVFTRRKDEHPDPNKQELFYEILDIIIIALITLEELLMHNKSVEQYVFVIGIVGYVFAIKSLEFGLHNKDTKQNFEASVVIGNLIPIFILQTMLQELDSYECVIIALSIQTILIINELFELIFFYQQSKIIEYTLKSFFMTLFIIPSLYVNYVEWLGIFFDEIVSLFVYDKTVLVTFFYTVLVFVLVEIWKRRTLFKGKNFI